MFIGAGIHRMLARITNRINPDQTHQSDLSLHCFSRHFWQATRIQVFYHLLYHICLAIRKLFSKNLSFWIKSLWASSILDKVFIRGSSNKEWDFFYSAVILHARLMKFLSKLARLFGCSQVPYFTFYIVPTVVARQH